MHSKSLNLQCAALLALMSSHALRTAAEPFQLVSVVDATQGAPTGGGGDSWLPIISPDGRYVLFASTANNLVLNNSSNPIRFCFRPK